MSKLNYYAILGVHKTASFEQIDAAYRAKILGYSVSAAASREITERSWEWESRQERQVSGARAAMAERGLQELADYTREAWETLSNPELRAAYDAIAPEWENSDWYTTALYPDMMTDEEPDFTANEYIMRPKAAAAVLGSTAAVIVLHILSGLYMDPAQYLSFCLRSLLVCAAAWGGYFILRTSIVSKGWLLIYMPLCGFAHTIMNYGFFFTLYITPNVRGPYGRNDARPFFVGFYTLMFLISFIPAAISLEKGSFRENIRGFDKLFRGRFNKPGW